MAGQPGRRVPTVCWWEPGRMVVVREMVDLRADVARAEPVSPVLQYLRSLRDELRRDTRGTVATYIPELGLADPGSFGICVVTSDGHVYEVGDCRESSRSSRSRSRSCSAWRSRSAAARR